MNIHPLAVIGSPPEHRNHRPGHQEWAPWIHPTAKVNAFVTVDSGIKERTTVGEGAFVMAHCHIGHDAKIGAYCELAPGTVIGGHAVLEDKVRCGIGVLVKPFVTVGTGARLGAGAVVVKDVPAGEVWVGNPARPLAKSQSSRPHEPAYGSPEFIDAYLGELDEAAARLKQIEHSP